MSNNTVGKLLPNLNISCETKNTSSDFKFVKDNKINSESTVTIHRPTFQPLVQNPKVYKNKDGGFSTGIDLLSEENEEILSKRAERFGLNMEESKPTIKALYDSLGITVENKKAGKLKHIRLDTLHMRGVEKLNEKHILKYFQKYGPREVEWIDDKSCNILFNDEASSARALLGLSKIFPASFHAKLKNSTKCTSEESFFKEEEKMDIDNAPDDIKIPVPPGHWRLGEKHPSAETLLLRFATTGDKKLPGAEKRSKYYQKYGNPNYNGLTGIISDSRKLKVKRDAYKWSASKNKAIPEVSSFPGAPKNKTSLKDGKIRSFMYADEEELNIKRKREMAKKDSLKKSIHSRLGTKYTNDELLKISHSSSKSYLEPRKDSSSDLRNKIKKLRRDSAKYNYQHDEEHLINKHSSDEMKKQSRRVQENKAYYKRKHRSPLVDDEDESSDTS